MSVRPVETHKSTFLSQLKKMREVSNSAIRSTLQNERAEHMSLIGKLKEDFATKWESKTLDTGSTIQRLTLELEETRKQLLEYRRLADNAESNKGIAVESALHQIKFVGYFYNIVMNFNFIFVFLSFHFSGLNSNVNEAELILHIEKKRRD